MDNSPWPAPNDEIEEAARPAAAKWSVGDLLLIDGQRYACVALVPYWSQRQGAEIPLATFSTLCPDCAARFEATISSKCPRALARVRDHVPRRCPDCRAAGRRVRKVLRVPACNCLVN